MRLLCRLFGHADGAPFLKAPDVLAVKCAECGRVSEGMRLRPVRHQLSTHPTVVSIDAWRQAYDKERRTA